MLQQSYQQDIQSAPIVASPLLFLFARAMRMDTMEESMSNVTAYVQVLPFSLGISKNDIFSFTNHVPQLVSMAPTFHPLIPLLPCPRPLQMQMQPQVSTLCPEARFQYVAILAVPQHVYICPVHIESVAGCSIWWMFY